MKIRLLLTALTLAALPAAADVLQFDLTPAQLSGAAGQSTVLDFTGTLFNPGTTDVYLNGDLSALDPSLRLDDSPFLTSSPLFLQGGGTYTGPFFDVTVGPTTPPGTYFGSFAIAGGADASAFDLLATQDFTVNVTASTAPEPDFFEPLLAIFMILPYALGRRMRGRRELPGVLLR